MEDPKLASELKANAHNLQGTDRKNFQELFLKHHKAVTEIQRMEQEIAHLQSQTRRLSLEMEEVAAKAKSK
jgi:hypothetical protein